MSVRNLLGISPFVDGALIDPNVSRPMVGLATGIGTVVQTRAAKGSRAVPYGEVVEVRPDGGLRLRARHLRETSLYRKVSTYIHRIGEDKT